MFTHHLVTSLPGTFRVAVPCFGTPLLGYLTGARYQLLSASAASAARRTALLSLHGRSDPTIPAQGGRDADGWLYAAVPPWRRSHRHVHHHAPFYGSCTAASRPPPPAPLHHPPPLAPFPALPRHPSARQVRDPGARIRRVGGGARLQRDGARGGGADAVGCECWQQHALRRQLPVCDQSDQRRILHVRRRARVREERHGVGRARVGVRDGGFQRHALAAGPCHRATRW